MDHKAGWVIKAFFKIHNSYLWFGFQLRFKIKFYVLVSLYSAKLEVTHCRKSRRDRKKRMPDSNSATPIYPKLGVRTNATDKKLNFVPQIIIKRLGLA